MTKIRRAVVITPVLFLIKGEIGMLGTILERFLIVFLIFGVMVIIGCEFDNVDSKKVEFINDNKGFELRATVMEIPLEGITTEKRIASDDSVRRFTRILRLRAEDSTTYTVYLNDNYPAEEAIHAGDRVLVTLERKVEWPNAPNNAYIGFFRYPLYEKSVPGIVREISDYQVHLKWRNGNLVRVIGTLDMQAPSGRCVVSFDHPEPLLDSISVGDRISVSPKGKSKSLYNNEIWYHGCVLQPFSEE
jgi:hypothetical protein